jgi:hypothetical protein
MLDRFLDLVEGTGLPVQVDTLMQGKIDALKSARTDEDNAKADAALANRQAAAAKARAAKGAKTVGPAGPAGPAVDARGPIDAAELNGSPADALADNDPLEFPDAASMSPGEARDAGLALVRQAYAAGRVAEVKALQKAWQVSKFYDVPVEKGHVFYAAAMKLAQDAGLRP